jgi:hypothetical protein
MNIYVSCNTEKEAQTVCKGLKRKLKRTGNAIKSIPKP